MTGKTYELSVTRLIDAPVETVWRVATERMAEWWCPTPWTVELVEQDWRAGGRSAMVMHGPNGEAMPQEGVFLEVPPNQRFVFTDAFGAGWRPRSPLMVGVMEFANEGGRPATPPGEALDPRSLRSAQGDGVSSRAGTRWPRSSPPWLKPTGDIALPITSA